VEPATPVVVEPADGEPADAALGGMGGIVSGPVRADAGSARRPSGSGPRSPRAPG